MTWLRTLTALTVLLALLAMHIFVVMAVGYQTSNHSHDMGAMHHMTDCPFMNHSETLCPMTVLDHLAAFRSLFKSILPAAIVLVLIAGASVFWQLVSPQLRTFLFLHAHTFLRQRKFALMLFVYRQFQELFAQGILHQKVYG